MPLPVEKTNKIATQFAAMAGSVMGTVAEMARVGRIFRDVYAVELQAVLSGKKDAPYPDFVTNYRKSGHSAAKWLELAQGIGLLHSLLNDMNPADHSIDPSMTVMDVANVTTAWLDAGEASGNAVNMAVYNLCAVLSKLGHEVYFVWYEYDQILRPLVEALPTDDTLDGVTGRTKRQWAEAADALDAVRKVMFKTKTKRAFNYGVQLLRF